MPLCPRTAAWPSGNIAFDLLHNMYEGHDSTPAHALPFYYNNNSWHHSALFSVTQFCSVLFSSQGLSADQFIQCWALWSVLISTEQCWVGPLLSCFPAKMAGEGGILILIRTDQKNPPVTQRWSEHVGHRQDLPISVMFIFERWWMIYKVIPSPETGEIVCSFYLVRVVLHLSSLPTTRSNSSDMMGKLTKRDLDFFFM